MLKHCLVVVALAITLAGCASTKPDMPAAAATPAPSDAVAKLAYPGGTTEYVSRAEFEQARDKLMQNQSEEMVLDFVTSRHLLLQEARSQEMTADPKDTEQFLDNLRTQVCPTLPIPEAKETDPAKLLDGCAKFFGFTDQAAMQRYLRDDVIVNKLVQQEAKSGEELHAFHILVDTEAEAQAARTRVTTGKEDFATVAKEVSTDPSAQQNGGDLGFFGPGEMIGPFEEAASKLKDGEISQPVQTQFGWHVIKLIARRPAQQVSPAAADVYRRSVLQKAKETGVVQYLITPAPPPTAIPQIELPTIDTGAEVGPATEGTAVAPATPAP